MSELGHNSNKEIAANIPYQAVGEVSGNAIMGILGYFNFNLLLLF